MSLEKVQVVIYNIFLKIRDFVSLGLIVYAALKKPIYQETAMIEIFSKGENVVHNKKAEWGVGKITGVDKSGTIRVKFEGISEVSIAKGSKYLKKMRLKS
ncbi:MAG TPA: hypothetical protein DDY32_07715 [Desulfobulbaceae bacterium]|nr:hypothetical protein [Desulfobulbaceae bacterium]